MEQALSSISLQRFALIQQITDLRSSLMSNVANMRIRLLQEINDEFEAKCAAIQTGQMQVTKFAFNFECVEEHAQRIATAIDHLSGKTPFQEPSINSNSTEDTSIADSTTAGTQLLLFYSSGTLYLLCPVSLHLTSFYLPYPASCPSLCYLSDSAVVISGGLQSATAVSTVVFVDLNTGQFAATQPMHSAKSAHASIAVSTAIGRSPAA